MTDARHHTRDERGEWQPRIVTPAPWAQWPLKPFAVLKWLFGNPGYLLPWIAVLMLFPIVTGAARGMGHAIGMALMREGANVRNQLQLFFVFQIIARSRSHNYT